MKVITGKVLFVDVDNTLVYGECESPYSTYSHLVINGRKFYVHEYHVEFVKDCIARGISVVCWSGGGAEWASMVVSHLNLDVVACMSKPDWVMDDSPIDMWLGEDRRFFFGPDGTRQKTIGEL